MYSVICKITCAVFVDNVSVLKIHVCFVCDDIVWIAFNTLWNGNIFKTKDILTFYSVKETFWKPIWNHRCRRSLTGCGSQQSCVVVNQWKNM